ncbi:hypothetical protein [Pedobacter sp. BMA]|uniref:hypothetical protein n=1 Tax=Pedobacter sp. BMA TaxID=1663685 RepID=UPI00069E3DA2|nr:hypothetical protein [Pedobacter sp. BMA]
MEESDAKSVISDAVEAYTIAMGDGETHTFHVNIYPHHAQSTCRYSVFQGEKLVAALAPNSQGFLYICQNPGDIREDLLDQLCEAVELRHPDIIDDDDEQPDQS